MKELKCPNCQHVFQVDEDLFESLANQVRNAAFEDEVKRRTDELRERMKLEVESRTKEVENNFAKRLNDKDLTLAKRDSELELARRNLETIAREKEAEFDKKLAARDAEIEKLRSAVAQNDSARKIALLEERQASAEQLRKKDNEIAELRTSAANERNKAIERENNLKEQHSLELRQKQELIDYYKEMKARLSTKMIGESLEIHCQNEFNRVRAMMYPNAYFDKDNDASEGTKGDFIFRDYIDGVEYISIMFEMKNEADNTAAPHRNEEFFAKLHRDRCKKNCEYAVLVTMLEPESELYNKGIVDVSHRYEKMFVIRPQFFISLIGLLTKGARTAFAYKRKLAAKEEENISFVNFRNKILTIQEGIFGNYEKAHASIEKSVKQIDSSIKTLNSLREELLRWEKYMRLASDKAGGLTVKKLTYGNPIVRKAIESAEAASDPESPDISESPLIPSE